MPGPAPRAEFDAFAAGYDGGIRDRSSVWPARSADTFFEHKVDWLLRNLSPAGRLLDFGCGTGTFLGSLRRSGARSSCSAATSRPGWSRQRAPVDAGALAGTPGRRARPVAARRRAVRRRHLRLRPHHIDPARAARDTQRAGPRAEPGGHPRRLEHNLSIRRRAGWWHARRSTSTRSCCARRTAHAARALRRRARAHGLHPVLPARVRRLWSLGALPGARALGGHMWSSAETPSEG